MGGIWFRSEVDLQTGKPKAVPKKFDEDEKLRFSEKTLADTK